MLLDVHKVTTCIRDRCEFPELLYIMCIGNPLGARPWLIPPSFHSAQPGRKWNVISVCVYSIFLL